MPSRTISSAAIDMTTWNAPTASTDCRESTRARARTAGSPPCSFARARLGSRLAATEPLHSDALKLEIA